MSNKLGNIDGFREVARPHLHEDPVDVRIGKLRQRGVDYLRSNNTPLPKTVPDRCRQGSLPFLPDLEKVWAGYNELNRMLESEECNPSKASTVHALRRQACIDDPDLPIYTDSENDLKREMSLRSETYRMRYLKKFMPIYFASIFPCLVSLLDAIEGEVVTQLDGDAREAADFGIEPGAPSYVTMCLWNFRTQIRGALDHAKAEHIRFKAGYFDQNYPNLNILKILGVEDPK